MLRAARFASQLEMSVDPEAIDAMANMAERIDVVSAERIRDELVKLVLPRNLAPGCSCWWTRGCASGSSPNCPL